MTSGEDDRFPECTPDGRWVYFTAQPSGIATLWKVAIEGGKPIEVSARYAAEDRISPDGRWLLVLTSVPGGPPGNNVEVRSLETGEVRSMLPSRGPLLRWAPDSRTLTYPAVENGVWGIGRCHSMAGTPAP